MKLWILKPREDLPKEDNPWNPWYDKAFGFIVAAETEKGARRVASECSGTENPGYNHDDFTNCPWEFEEYSSCKILVPEDYECGLVLMDFRSA